MSEPNEITPRQMELLKDLAALEDAGLIHKGTSQLAYSGYDEGSIEVEIPAIVTYKGRKALS